MPFPSDFRRHPAHFRDSLAAELWSARTEARRVSSDPAQFSVVSVDRAGRIASELYKTLEEAGDRAIGWKVGATDVAAQRRLGATSPFVAPLFERGTFGPDASISLSDFVHPSLELEIGVTLQRGILAPVACVEIIDSRLPRNSLTLAGAIADFGLQGCVLFGQPLIGPPAVSVSLHRDGIKICTVQADTSLALRTAGAIPSVKAHALTDGARIATGSLNTPVPLEPGVWTTTFGGVGKLHLEVSE